MLWRCRPANLNASLASQYGDRLQLKIPREGTKGKILEHKWRSWLNLGAENIHFDSWRFFNHHLGLAELLKKREPKFGFRISQPRLLFGRFKREGVEIYRGSLPIPESLNETLISLEGGIGGVLLDSHGAVCLNLLFWSMRRLRCYARTGFALFWCFVLGALR